MTGVSWHLVGVLAGLASIVVIYALNKHDPESKIIRTKYVDKAMVKDNRPKQPWEN